MREKLIDVFCTVLGVSVDHKTDEAYQFIDDLIANGVTIQKWIPVTERLPEESGEYLAYCGGYDGICVLYYEILKTKGKWRSKWKEVTHWMPLPYPDLE